MVACREYYRMTEEFEADARLNSAPMSGVQAFDFLLLGCPNRESIPRSWRIGFSFGTNERQYASTPPRNSGPRRPPPAAETATSPAARREVT
jgi:hypothetical protein